MFFIWFCLLLFAFRFEVLHFVFNEMCFECLFCRILGSGPIGPPPPGVFIIVVVVVVCGLCCGCVLLLCFIDFGVSFIF